VLVNAVQIGLHAMLEPPASFVLQSTRVFRPFVVVLISGAEVAGDVVRQIIAFTQSTARQILLASNKHKDYKHY